MASNPPNSSKRVDRKLLRLVGWAATLGSATLFVLVLLVYGAQLNHLAAMAVVPAWIWGLHGIACHAVSGWAIRRRLAGLGIGLWIAVSLFFADEAAVLGHSQTETLEPRRTHPQRIRVATLNAAHFTFGNPADDLAHWDPDLVLLQEVHHGQVRQVAQRLFGEAAHFKAYTLNGIASRWPVKSELRPKNSSLRYVHHNVTLQLPDEQQLQIVNLHLSSATTDLRLWRAEAWRSHRANRLHRQNELRRVLDSIHPEKDPPTLLAGDFNAPPWDPVHDLLQPEFSDAFEQVGKGWGNTFHRRIPLLRLDQIHAGPGLRPEGCLTVTTRHSDHRFVVADFSLD